MKKEKNKKVFVALSGGVDSAVAAALLKREGYQVTGVFMKEYDLSFSGRHHQEIQCTQGADQKSALAVAAALGIPFLEWDFRSVYKREVVRYLVREYRAGRTPNPDVACNAHVKFGVFLQRAKKFGADFIATGHYVKALQRARGGGYTLSLVRDINKDQSYFLYRLTQEQLRSCLFPLAEYTKPEVRKLAQKFQLPNWDRKDSQGICFIGDISMKDFLKQSIKPRQGRLELLDGTSVGIHEGAAYYTIGQRHGIGFGGGGAPLFVVGKDMKKNIVYVAPDKPRSGLYRKELACADIHWVSGMLPRTPLKCTARIRYRQPLQVCTLRKVNTKTWSVLFQKPQKAITSGQAIVFYQGVTMLGGGTIN